MGVSTDCGVSTVRRVSQSNTETLSLFLYHHVKADARPLIGRALTFHFFLHTHHTHNTHFRALRDCETTILDFEKKRDKNENFFQFQITDISTESACKEKNTTKKERKKQFDEKMEQ